MSCPPRREDTERAFKRIWNKDIAIDTARVGFPGREERKRIAGLHSSRIARDGKGNCRDGGGTGLPAKIKKKGELVPRSSEANTSRNGGKDPTAASLGFPWWKGGERDSVRVRHAGEGGRGEEVFPATGKKRTSP